MATPVAQVYPVAVAPRTLSPQLHVGDYYSTERDLYRIEEVHGEFALIEDCRTEIVLEVAVSEILGMDRVRHSGS
jgi:hypothetical protein